MKGELPASEVWSWLQACRTKSATRDCKNCILEGVIQALATDLHHALSSRCTEADAAPSPVQECCFTGVYAATTAPCL